MVGKKDKTVFIILLHNIMMITWQTYFVQLSSYLSSVVSMYENVDESIASFENTAIPWLDPRHGKEPKSW